LTVTYTEEAVADIAEATRTSGSTPKRQALDALDVQRGCVVPAAGKGSGGDGDGAEIRAVVELPESVTSQSRHSLLLQGSPPSGKLLIPLERRDVRVVEGARLEIDSHRAC
jgi:hypothetical protein